MSFKKLTEILKQVRNQYPLLSKRIDEAQALERWEAAVGSVIAKHARAIRVQNKVLWVEVEHPIWKSELHHRKRQILDLLNARLADAPKGDPVVIEDILFLDPRSGSR